MPIKPQTTEQVDASFTNITQYRDLKSKESIGIWLKNQKLLKERVSPRLFGEYKWLIDIDGNVNSWDCYGNFAVAAALCEWKVVDNSGFIINDAFKTFYSN